MDECKALLEGLKAEQVKTNDLLTQLLVLLGEVANG
jgi:hypothetical protein